MLNLATKIYHTYFSFIDFSKANLITLLISYINFQTEKEY